VPKPKAGPAKVEISLELRTSFQQEHYSVITLSHVSHDLRITSRHLRRHLRVVIYDVVVIYDAILPSFPENASQFKRGVSLRAFELPDGSPFTFGVLRGLSRHCRRWLMPLGRLESLQVVH
jgi:hypothetical protein